MTRGRRWLGALYTIYELSKQLYMVKTDSGNYVLKSFVHLKLRSHEILRIDTLLRPVSLHYIQDQDNLRQWWISEYTASCRASGGR